MQASVLRTAKHDESLFKYEFVNERQAVKDLIEKLNATQDFICLDLETTGLDRFTDTIECFTITTNVAIEGGGSAAYIPAEFCDELLNIQVPLVLHNFKFDFLFLLSNGVDLRKLGVPVIDTMLMHHLLDENAEHGLDSIIQSTFKDNYKEVFWGKYKSYQEAPFSDKLAYACKDVIYTGHVFLDMQSKLALSQIPAELVEQTHAFALALYDTEARGIALDMPYIEQLGLVNRQKAFAVLEQMNSLCASEIDAIEMRAWVKELDARKTAKGKANVERPQFNWSSGKQLQELVYGELGLTEVRKKSKTTKKVRPVLDDEALEQLKEEHAIIPLLQDYRANEKVYTSFIEGVIEKQNKGRIYPSFNVNGTVGHRISMSNPNLQQMPAEGGIRGMVLPDPGMSLIGADFSSLEVVVAAHFSHDKNLLRIINEGASKHDITAESLKIPRKDAKTVNFAAQYLCGPQKLAQLLGVSQAEGKNIHRKYWETYAGDKAVVDECKRKVDIGESIVDISGRHRRFPKSFDAEWQKESAYRQAYSFLIQSSGAYCCNLAFTQIHDYLTKRAIGDTLLVIHDEIIIQANDSFLDEAEEMLVAFMEGTAKQVGLTVPLKAVSDGPMKRWED